MSMMPPGGHPWHPEMQNLYGTGPHLASNEGLRPHVKNQAELDDEAAQEAKWRAMEPERLRHEAAAKARQARRRQQLPALLTPSGFADAARALLRTMEQRGWPHSEVLDLGPSWRPGRRKQARAYLLSTRSGESDGVGAARNFIGSTTYLLQDGRIATRSISAYVGQSLHVHSSPYEPTTEQAERLLDLMDL